MTTTCDGTGQFANIEQTLRSKTVTTVPLVSTPSMVGKVSLGESSKYYVQGGPTFLSRDGAEDLEYQVGGKVGIKTKLTEDVTLTVSLKGLQW